MKALFFSAQIAVVRFCASLTLIGFVLTVPCAAQQYPYAGFPMFSTQLGSQYEQVDIADGNVSLEIPLRNIAVGPLPLSYMLFGASNAYKYNNGTQYQWQITSPSFALLPNMGASITETVDPDAITCNGNLDTLYSNFAVVDTTGTVHPVNILTFDSQGCYKFMPGTYPAEDGSGYTVVLSGTYSSWSTTLYDKSGNTYSGSIIPSLTNIVTPDNVTAQTVTGSLDTFCGTCTSTESITDPLTSNPIVYAQGTRTSGKWTSLTYSYTNSQGKSINPPYAVNYNNYNVATNFQCSGIAEIYTASPQLLSSIATPDGGEYLFTYEATPNKSGYVTGRIASITLPSGGSISYSYSGGNSGINCTSQIVPTLTRKISDNNGHTDTWTYVNSNTSSSGYPNFTVVVTDPANNQTLYYMQGQFQTQVQSFQKGCTPTTIAGCSGGGTLLKTVTTCYNGVFSNCATPTGMISGPPIANFSQTDVYTSYNGGPNNLVETKYDSFGDPTEIKRYDFGINTGSAPTGTPLSDTVQYYGQSWNGTSCSAYPTDEMRRPVSDGMLYAPK